LKEYQIPIKSKLLLSEHEWSVIPLKFLNEKFILFTITRSRNKTKNNLSHSLLLTGRNMYTKNKINESLNRDTHFYIQNSLKVFIKKFRFFPFKIYFKIDKKVYIFRYPVFKNCDAFIFFFVFFNNISLGENE